MREKPNKPFAQPGRIFLLFLSSSPFHLAFLSLISKAGPSLGLDILWLWPAVNPHTISTDLSISALTRQVTKLFHPFDYLWNTNHQKKITTSIIWSFYFSDTSVKKKSWVESEKEKQKKEKKILQEQCTQNVHSLSPLVHFFQRTNTEVNHIRTDMRKKKSFKKSSQYKSTLLEMKQRGTHAFKILITKTQKKNGQLVLK